MARSGSALASNTLRSRELGRGFSMIEVLVTLVILMLGLLGLLGVQVRSHQAELEAYQRTQALLLLNDMVQRINANRKAAQCYAITLDGEAGAPYVGAGNADAPECTAWGVAATQARAVADLLAWDALLKGAAETDAGTEVGAMLGARGCIQHDPVTDVYRVSVAWQGLMPTADPTTTDPALTCAKDLYGTETLRRVVSTTLRIADLR